MHYKMSFTEKIQFKIKIVLINFALVIFLSFLIIIFIGMCMGKRLTNYALIESNRVSKTIINYAVNDIITDELKTETLFTTVQNKNGDIQTIDFDTGNVNKLLNEISQNILKYFRLIETGRVEKLDFAKNLLSDTYKIKKGIIMEIPSGVVFSNSLLSNLGPRIPVKLSMVGDLESNISTKIDRYGINNAVITVYVDVQVSEQVILPMYTKKTMINSRIPIAMKVIQGIVPDYYMGGNITNSELYSKSVR